MLRPMRLLSVTLPVLAALVLAACSGASGSGDTGGAPAAGDELFVSNGLEVLSASAERFEEEITSMEGSLEISVVADGMDFGLDADFAFDAPDAMYMAMTMSGDDGSGYDVGVLGTMELLIRDDVYYFSMPLFGGWVSMSLDSMGLSGTELDEMKGMLAGSAAFDYQALVDAFGDVEFVGEEAVGGRDMLHYSVSTDLEEAIAALSAAFDSAGGGVDQYTVDGVGGPITMDIWVGADDYLPYLMTMDFELTAPGEAAFSMDMTMRVDAYNSDVSIPDAPDDALSFDNVFGGEGDAPFDLGDLFGAGS